MSQTVAGAESGVRSGVRGLTFQPPRLRVLLLFFSVLLMVSLFYVWSRIQVIHLEYELSSLEGRQREALQEVQRLQLEAASLSNLSRIERIAKQEIGLKLPTADQVIMVR